MSNGKGSRFRKTNLKKYDDNYDYIFRKKKQFIQCSNCENCKAKQHSKQEIKSENQTTRSTAMETSSMVSTC